MTQRFENYTIGDTMPVLTARGAYNYAVARPHEGSADTRPVVLMATDDTHRMSLCNAMEDVAQIIMKREKWTNDNNAVWIETAENDSNIGQIVQRPSTMPAWSAEKRVSELLQDLQQPSPPAPAETGPSLG